MPDPGNLGRISTAAAIVDRPLAYPGPGGWFRSA